MQITTGSTESEEQTSFRFLLVRYSDANERLAKTKQIEDVATFKREF